MGDRYLLAFTKEINRFSKVFVVQLDRGRICIIVNRLIVTYNDLVLSVALLKLILRQNLNPIAIGEA